MSETIVIDNGSYSLKVGFGGEDAPRSIEQVSSFYRSPTAPVIEKGIIVDWEQAEKLWNIDELKGSPVILTQSPLNTPEARRKSIELMFEKKGVSSLYLAYQPTMALYANGKLTGAVLDVGYHSTHASIVTDGNLRTVSRTDVGGEMVSRLYAEAIAAKLGSDAPACSPSASANRVEGIKKYLGYVRSDPSSDRDDKTHPESYELPDGSTIKTDDRLSWGIPEVLFEPSTAEGSSADIVGIHVALRQTLDKAKAAGIDVVSNEVLLVGGTSLHKGLPERLAIETQRFGSEPSAVVVEAPDDRRFSTWIGASILSTLSNLSVTRESYEEFGAEVVDTMLGSQFFTN